MSLQVDHVTAPEDKLSFGQKFAYGLGAIANNLLGGAIGYMSIVLNVGLGMNPALVGPLDRGDHRCVSARHRVGQLR